MATLKVGNIYSLKTLPATRIADDAARNTAHFLFTAKEPCVMTAYEIGGVKTRCNVAMNKADSVNIEMPLHLVDAIGTPMYVEVRTEKWVKPPEYGPDDYHA